MTRHWTAMATSGVRGRSRAATLTSETTSQTSSSVRTSSTSRTLSRTVQMDEGVQAVYDTLGASSDIDERSVKEALWNFYFVAEDAVAYLLGPILSCPT